MFARSRRVLANIASREEAKAALGLSLTEKHSLADAKAVYKRKVVELHPDSTVGLDKEERTAKEELFKKVAAAYAYLEEEGMGEAQKQAPAEGKGGCRWSPVPDDPLAYETRMRMKVKFAVAQVRDTGRVQHVPLIRNHHSFVNLHVVAQWVEEELTTQAMFGYSVDAVEVGPFGAPCVSIRGTPQASHVPGDAAAQHAAASRSFTNPLKRAFSSIKDFMTEQVPAGAETKGGGG